MKTVSKLLNPFHKTGAEDEKILHRVARSAQSSYGAPQPSYSPEPLMPYRYGYAVQDTDCNDFNQQEQSDGAQVGFKCLYIITEYLKIIGPVGLHSPSMLVFASIAGQ